MREFLQYIVRKSAERAGSNKLEEAKDGVDAPTSCAGGIGGSKIPDRNDAQYYGWYSELLKTTEKYYADNVKYMQEMVIQLKKDRNDHCRMLKASGLCGEYRIRPRRR